MKEVSFDYHGHDKYVVTDEAYEQIVQMVLENLRCGDCGQAYLGENIRVAQNQCARCFTTKSHPHLNLRFAHIMPADYDTRGYRAEKPTRWFTWLDPEGYIYLSSYSDTTARKDPGETLKYWNFPFPAEWVSPDGKRHVLHASEWSIYGDVKKRHILIINYRAYSYDTVPDLQYMTVKGGEYTLLDKRKKDIRELYKECDQSGGHGKWKSYDYDKMLDILEARQTARMLVAAQPSDTKPDTAKQEPVAQKPRPSFGNADWIQVAKGKMRPWERAIWKGVGEDA